MMLNTLRGSKRREKPVCSLCCNGKGGTMAIKSCIPHCIKEAKVVIERLNLSDFRSDGQRKKGFYGKCK